MCSYRIEVLVTEDDRLGEQRFQAFDVRFHQIQPESLVKVHSTTLIGYSWWSKGVVVVIGPCADTLL
jgi:hypothetical protein